MSTQGVCSHGPDAGWLLSCPRGCSRILGGHCAAGPSLPQLSSTRKVTLTVSAVDSLLNCLRTASSLPATAAVPREWRRCCPQGDI